MPGGVNFRSARVAKVIAFAQKHPIQAQASADKAHILDEDLLEADDFIEGKRVPSGLHYRAAPSLQPVARRPFAFNLETSADVGQQHEARRARDQVATGAAHRVAGLRGEIEFQELLESLRAPDDRTEPARAQKIVAHTVTL